MSCTLPNSGAASHRHATYRYPGKPLMCCAEHAEPGMVSPNQGSSNRTARPCPAGWCIEPRLPCRLAPPPKVSPLFASREQNMAHTSVQSTLCVCSATQPWHDSRVCAAPRSTHQLGQGTRTLLIFCVVHQGRAGALAQPHLAFQVGCWSHHMLAAGAHGHGTNPDVASKAHMVRKRPMLAVMWGA